MMFNKLEKQLERHYLRLKYLRFDLVGDEHEKIIQCNL